MPCFLNSLNLFSCNCWIQLKMILFQAASKYQGGIYSASGGSSPLLKNIYTEGSLPCFEWQHLLFQWKCSMHHFWAVFLSTDSESGSEVLLHNVGFIPVCGVSTKYISSLYQALTESLLCFLDFMLTKCKTCCHLSNMFFCTNKGWQASS